MEESVILGEVTDNQVDAGLEEVDFAAELLGEEQQQEAPVETANEQGVGDPGQEEQKRIGEAFAAESRRIEAKFRREYEAKAANDPVRIMGMRVLEEVMRSQNVPMEQAMKIAEENYYNAIAERENVSPAIARAVFSRQQQPQAQEQDVYARAAEIHRDLANLDLPEGFSFETAIKDQRFAQMLLDMPTEAAIRVYHAEKRASEAQQDVAERLRARQSLPQTMKPQQPVTPNVDFMKMTDEEFFQYERQLE